MAKTLPFKLITILSLVLLLLLALHFERVDSFDVEDNDDEEDEYVLDSIYANTTTTRKSRFLSATIKKIKKGTHCDGKTNPYVCNGVWANKGTSLLYCCKKHCRNVLGDRNNCGYCGKKCAMGQRCCGGVCTDVMKNRNNCGKCNKKCRYGVKCEQGYCGYAS